MLKTNRLNLRPFTDSDLDILHQLHSNPEVARTTIDGIQSREQVQKQLENFIAHQEKFGYSQLAVFENESLKFVGRAGLTTRTLNQEIGELTEIRFAFLPEFWGEGYASEVARELIRFGFEDLKLEKMSASSGTTNEKSFRVLTKYGFKFVKNILPEGYGSADEIRFYLMTYEDYLNFFNHKK
jgi:ribosomal-protein-alanine N-acetyltransferase